MNIGEMMHRIQESGMFVGSTMLYSAVNSCTVVQCVISDAST